MKAFPWLLFALSLPFASPLHGAERYAILIRAESDGARETLKALRKKWAAALPAEGRMEEENARRLLRESGIQSTAPADRPALCAWLGVARLVLIEENAGVVSAALYLRESRESIPVPVETAVEVLLPRLTAKTDWPWKSVSEIERCEEIGGTALGARTAVQAGADFESYRRILLLGGSGVDLAACRKAGHSVGDYLAELERAR